MGAAKFNLNKVPNTKPRAKDYCQTPQVHRHSRLHSGVQARCVKDHTIKTTKNFYDRTKTSKYDLIKNLANYEYKQGDNYRRLKEFPDVT